MVVSRDEFLRQLHELEILSPLELQELYSRPASVETEQLARELVQRTRLTVFQAQQLKSGAGKSLVLGRNILLDELGRGGMGIVYKAVHRTMKRTVALKVQLPGTIQNRESIARFRREIEAAARLDHPNIVAVYDADESEGKHFYVMQYVEGRDLRKIVADEGPLPPRKAVDCVLQAARGLAYAHKKGVIHRDIKPVNLLRGADGVVKVLDLGLARFLEGAESEERLTNTGAVLGTFDYMAPEQAGNSKAADSRSDIYSLGMTLWFLLTGRRAYEAGNLLARLRAHLEQPIPSLADHLPASSTMSISAQFVREVDDVFRRMVAKAPADRFSSMDAVITALERCLRLSHERPAEGPSRVSVEATVAQPRAQPKAEVLPVANPESTLTDGSTVKARQGGFLQTAQIVVGVVVIVVACTAWNFLGRNGLPSRTSNNPPPIASRSLPPTIQAPVGARFVLIPAGEFLMGAPVSDPDADSDERPQRRVRITRPFYLGIHEVTKGQFARFVAEKSFLTEAERDGQGGGGFDSDAARFVSGKSYTWRSTGWSPYEDDHPVVNVSWNDAVAFCNWQSEADGLTPCYEKQGDAFVRVSGTGYRLPTEAEWEYACRAGTNTRYGSGDSPESLVGFANVSDASARSRFPDWTLALTASDRFAFTAPVGTYKPNAFGLYDMHGNVWEWCSDWYAPDPHGIGTVSIEGTISDPEGPAQGTSRVVRGGGAFYIPSYCRSANRDSNTPGIRNFDRGFRLARSAALTAPDAPPTPRTLATEGATPRQQAPARSPGRNSPAGLELVLVPAGEYLMGASAGDSEATRDELPQRQVRITRPFYLGKYEVTRGQFAKFVAATGHTSEAERDGEGGWGYDPATRQFVSRTLKYTWRNAGWTPYDDDHPVINVTWNDAAAFCNWQSEAEDLAPCYERQGNSFAAVSGNGYRLPTEAEWEYACRAGSTTIYSNGDDPELLVHIGNVSDRTLATALGMSLGTASTSDGYAFTAPVGRFPSNAFGVYDMHGNVAEWCADWFDRNYYTTRPETDPPGPASGTHRVSRGGGWDDKLRLCRSSKRLSALPNGRGYSHGFRIARDSPAE